MLLPLYILQNEIILQQHLSNFKTPTLTLFLAQNLLFQVTFSSLTPKILEKPTPKVTSIYPPPTFY